MNARYPLYIGAALAAVAGAFLLGQTSQTEPAPRPDTGSKHVRKVPDQSLDERADEHAQAAQPVEKPADEAPPVAPAAPGHRVSKGPSLEETIAPMKDNALMTSYIATHYPGWEVEVTGFGSYLRRDT